MVMRDNNIMERLLRARLVEKGTRLVKNKGEFSLAGTLKRALLKRAALSLVEPPALHT